jgi:hypothetical protein
MGWYGIQKSAYHKSDTDLNKSIDKIAKKLNDIPSDKLYEHFFKVIVIIKDYDKELSLFINNEEFKSSAGRVSYGRYCSC